MKIRKLLYLILALAVMLSLVACGGGDDGDSNGGGDDETPVKTYTVSFDVEGIPKQTVEDGKLAEEPTAPSRDYYLFGGWRCNGEEWSFDTPVTKDVTLTAVWVPVDFDISYYDGDDKLTLEPIKYNVETDSFKLPDAPSKAHYEFCGWYTDKELTAPIEGITKGSNGHITVYAKYSPVTYTIDYVVYGGSYPDTNPREYTLLDRFELEGAELAGYSFDGWYTDESFSSDTRVTVIEGGELGSITLYANFIPNTYSIEYVLDNGENGEGNPEYFTVEDDIDFADAKKKGYSFVGWYTTFNFDEDSKVTSVSSLGPASTVLYAKFSANSYGITYELDGGENHENNPETFTVLDAISLGNAEKEGYTFLGWYTTPTFDEGTKIGIIIDAEPEPITLYAKFEITVHRVAYELNGGVNGEGNPNEFTFFDSFVLKDAEKEGYEFIGWYTDPYFDENTKVPVINGFEREALTLYARFELKKYVIIYDLCGGVNGDNPAEFTILDSFVLKDAEKEGYNFLGWYTTPTFDDGTRITFIENPKPEDLYLYARFELESYAITYELNGGVNHGDNPATYTSADSSFQFLAPTRSGYKFAGWFLDDNYKTQVSTLRGKSGDITLYAKWDVDSGGGIITPEDNFHNS